MPLHLTNTATGRKQLLEPLQPGRVSVYCCGVTVYDYCHLGHARSYLTWDVLRRYLQSQGYQVDYVQNFTDIDDKILRRAKVEGRSMEAVSQEFIQAYFADMAALNILPATHYPRATGVIPAIVELIQVLVDRGYAYPAGGDVYYAVERFPPYGSLSGRRPEALEPLGPEEYRKRHPLDFALWKGAKLEELGAYQPWDSPWGPGRPGWHIECSAMVRSYLGDQIDLHCGGQDLIFPHHENEIAQSEAVTGKTLAQGWLHNGFVNILGEKMSKSLGNFTTIRELLRVYDPNALRLWVLQSHYRKPMDFTPEALAAAEGGWQTLQEGLASRPVGEGQIQPQAYQRFQAAMDDDLNTPQALTVLFELAKSLHKAANRRLHQGEEASPPGLIDQWQTLAHLSEILGFKVPESPTSPESGQDQEAQIEAKVAERQTARQIKDYQRADQIRRELQQMGISLVDQPGGEVKWYKTSRQP